MALFDGIKKAFKDVEEKVEHALDPVESPKVDTTTSTTVNASLATSIVSATAVSGDTHPVIQATEE